MLNNLTEFEQFKKLYEEHTVGGEAGYGNNVSWGNSLIGRGFNSLFSMFKKNIGRARLTILKNELENEFIKAVFRYLKNAGYKVTDGKLVAPNGETLEKEADEITALLTFEILEYPDADIKIDFKNKTINIDLPSGTTSQLTPIIEIEEGYTNSLAENTKIDIANPVKFTISNEENSEEWTIQKVASSEVNPDVKPEIKPVVKQKKNLSDIINNINVLTKLKNSGKADEVKDIMNYIDEQVIANYQIKNDSDCLKLVLINFILIQYKNLCESTKKDFDNRIHNFNTKLAKDKSAKDEKGIPISDLLKKEQDLIKSWINIIQIVEDYIELIINRISDYDKLHKSEFSKLNTFEEAILKLNTPVKPTASGETVASAKPINKQPEIVKDLSTLKIGDKISWGLGFKGTITKKTNTTITVKKTNGVEQVLSLTNNIKKLNENFIYDLLLEKYNMLGDIIPDAGDFKDLDISLLDDAELSTKFDDNARIEVAKNINHNAVASIEHTADKIIGVEKKDNDLDNMWKKYKEKLKSKFRLFVNSEEVFKEAATIQATNTPKQKEENKKQETKLVNDTILMEFMAKTNIPVYNNKDTDYHIITLNNLKVGILCIKQKNIFKILNFIDLAKINEKKDFKMSEINLFIDTENVRIARNSVYKNWNTNINIYIAFTNSPVKITNDKHTTYLVLNKEGDKLSINKKGKPEYIDIANVNINDPAFIHSATFKGCSTIKSSELNNLAKNPKFEISEQDNIKIAGKFEKYKML